MKPQELRPHSRSLAEASTMSLPDRQVVGLLDQLRELEDSIPQDEALRDQLFVALQGLSLAIETPLDTVR